MKNISALIVAHNEEKNLPLCLASLSDIDELVLILDKTTDNSKNIAKKYNCKIHEGSWNNEGKRRNFGISKCSNNWILEIDSDERANIDLVREAKEKINAVKENTNGYFLVPFVNFVGSKRIRYGWGASWGVTHKPCLFHKSSKVWGSEPIHPSLKLGNKLGTLENSINHYIDKNISDMIARLDRYSALKAVEIRESTDKIPSLAITIRRSITRFWKCYISRKGYKEGKWGFIIALFAALFILLSYLKADLEDDNNNPKS